MKEILLECVNFYGDNWQEKIFVPDDIAFVKTKEFFNDKIGRCEQRFYSALYPYDKKTFSKMENAKTVSRFSVYNIANKWIFAEIWNAFPVNEDITEITIDEFNERYKNEIEKFVFSHKMLKKYSITKLVEELSTKEEVSEDDVMFTTNMSKLLKFKKGGEHLYAEIVKVSFSSWIDGEDIKSIGVKYEEFCKLLPQSFGDDKYTASEDKKEWDKFNNRVQETLKYCKL